MTDTATLVVTAVPGPDEMASVQAYLQGAMPLLTGAGCRPGKRLKVDEVLNGRPGGRVLVIGFSSADAVREVLASDACAAPMPARDKGFAEINIQLTREI